MEAEKEPEHVGMHGRPCQCGGPARREAERLRGGCSLTCYCHDKPHAECPNAHPCYGRCGRWTTSGESPGCGYCLHCSSDQRWRPIDDVQIGWPE